MLEVGARPEPHRPPVGGVAVAMPGLKVSGGCGRALGVSSRPAHGPSGRAEASYFGSAPRRMANPPRSARWGGFASSAQSCYWKGECEEAGASAGQAAHGEVTPAHPRDPASGADECQRREADRRGDQDDSRTAPAAPEQVDDTGSGRVPSAARRRGCASPTAVAPCASPPSCLEDNELSDRLSDRKRDGHGNGPGRRRGRRHRERRDLGVYERHQG